MIQAGIIILYFAATICVGVLTKKTNNANAFEGFKLSLLMCVAIGAGEWMGGTSTTGVSEYGYLYGISGAWYTVANGVGICFLALFFARLFRSLNSSTVPEIIGRYLGRSARTVSSVMLTIVLIIVGVSQLIAVGTLGETLLHLDPALSILILGLGVLVYTCLGGMNAIGVTNVLHMIVMYAGVVIAVIICSGTYGSLSGTLPEKYFSPVSIGYDKVFSWIVASVLGACTAQAGLQPILKSRDEKTAVRSSFIIALIVAPFGILTALLGMYAKVGFPDLTNAKLALPTLLMNMNPWVAGLVMAAILAAILSTASPIFLACGTLITRDLYCTWKKTKNIPIQDRDRKLLRVSRSTTFGTGMVCILLAVLLSSKTTILDIVYFAYSLRGSLFVVLLLGIFWKRTNWKTAIYAMVCTTVVGFLWVGYKKINGTYPIPFLTETYAAVLTTLVVGIGGSLIAGRKVRQEAMTANPVKRKTIEEWVAAYAQETPDKPAVITGKISLTYRELWKYAQGYAQYLISGGIKKGDIVLLKASQTAEYVVQYLGIHLGGGIVTSLEKSISDNGIVEIAKKISAKVIVSDNTLMGELLPVQIIPQGDVLSLAAEHAGDGNELPVATLEDSADILFTTGTTGASKGVELSHKALVATAENLIYGCEYKKDTTIIVPGPLNHANAIRKVFTTLVNGSTIYILNGMMNMKAFFDAIESVKGHIACCLPPASIRVIFMTTGDKLGTYPIDFIESATAPLPETDKKKLCELLPDTRLYNNYGSSEAASVCMYDYNHYKDKDNCVGKPMPNSKIIIVDDRHEEMISSRDNLGLLACVGDINMKGYVNEPALTSEVLENGIVYTSDLGYIDKEGFVYVIGRKGDVINVGGLKVAPSEVESAALGFPGVADCICIAVEDKITTNALKLLVVMQDGHEFQPRAMSEFLGRTLEAYKIPRFYERVDKVERTYNGKLNRKYYR